MTPFSGDGNALRLSLTPPGRSVVRQATQAARDVDALFFGSDAASMRDALRRIAEHGR